MTRRRAIRLATFLCAGLLEFGGRSLHAAPVAPSLPRQPRRFALVVGANDAGRTDLAPLRYADDDAIRNAEVLRELGAEVSLLTSPDVETQALFPRARAASEAPTRARILEQVASLFRDAAEAKAAGQQTDFYFFFAGHGGFSESGEGVLFLPDGALTRGDLYNLILARSPADFNHLVIDACHAYFFVSTRGSDAEIDRRLEERARQYLDAQTLDRFPNTGVLVATSAADSTVEWSDYQGGVFSHEVRSALLGGADLDNDRQITYAEVGAFIAAANAAVVHVRAKLNVFVRPPARAPQRPLVGWKAAPLAWLSVERQVAGHLWIEDENGVRLSETNKSSDQPMHLALLRRPRYFLRLGSEEYNFVATPGQEIKLADLSATAPQFRERGSLSEALRHGLFAIPFGMDFYLGYQLELSRHTPVESKAAAAAAGSPRQRAVYALLAGGIFAAGAAVALRIESNSAYTNFQRATAAQDQQHWAGRTKQLDWATLIATVVAGASGATAAGLLAHDALATPGPAILLSQGTVQASLPF